MYKSGGPLLYYLFFFFLSNVYLVSKKRQTVNLGVVFVFTVQSIFVKVSKIPIVMHIGANTIIDDHNLIFE